MWLKRPGWNGTVSESWNCMRNRRLAAVGEAALRLKKGGRMRPQDPTSGSLPCLGWALVAERIRAPFGRLFTSDRIPS